MKCMGGKEPPPLRNMTYTERALHIVDRQLKVAARDGSDAHSRNIRFTSGGYIYCDGNRIGRDAAVQMLAFQLEQEDQLAEQPQKTAKTPAGPITWDKLNQATQDFFFRLGEQIQSATKDASNSCGARFGHDIPRISLQDAPRLTNLKKAGLFVTREGAKKSHKVIFLTEAGQAIWAAHT